uniref:Protein kinase domain-containing protein n=1 Tax=Populus trichocarpa TaxID=3694 RepID=A0A2K1R9C2_POPTR
MRVVHGYMIFKDFYYFTICLLTVILSHTNRYVQSLIKGLDLKTGSFTLRQLKATPDNFNSENKIGEGGFGSVYKGETSSLI